MIDYSKPPKIDESLLQAARQTAKRVKEYMQNRYAAYMPLCKTPFSKPEPTNWKKEGF